MPVPLHSAFKSTREPIQRDCGFNPSTLAPRRWTIFALCLLVIGISGCPLDPVEQSLNNAITALQTQSGDWQATLQNLQTELVKEGQSTLANEVQSVLNRGIATTSVEFRCDVSFLGSELAQAVKNILAAYKNKTPPGQPPHFCNVDPSAIDLRLTPDRRPATLNIYGFNFASGSITVAVVDQNGSKSVPPPGIFSLPTEFIATFNIVNYPFAPTSSYVSFMLPGGEERRVDIVQAPSCGGVGQPCCQTGNACDAGAGCLANQCRTCPGPQDLHQPLFQKNNEFAGNNCTGVDEDRHYAGLCDNGFLRDDPPGLNIRDACDVCTAVPRWTNPAINDCRLTVHYHTPADCFKGIHVDILIKESLPIPQGCPSF